MSDPRPSASAPSRGRAPRIRVDRIACTGHGVCAQLLQGHVRLDEWGYPLLDDDRVDAEDGDLAIRFCPARALSWG